MVGGDDMLAALAGDRLLAEFSLWSADLVRMADDVARVDRFVDIYHADVADGHFSPAMLLFPDLIAQVRPLTGRPVHIHLMVGDDALLDQIDQFADAGADIISVHAENANAAAAIDHIRGRGLAAGIVLQLHTPVETARGLLARISMLTLLGTRMGIKGVGLDPAAEDRLAEARRMIDGSGARVLLAADGGIREHTVPGLRRAGADTVVMGSLAFGADDLASRMAWVHAQPGPS
ncbi:MAG: D-allulose-6-phosphate 3-epimerase [Pseudomonadota bacterium]|nr:D-allulose-6-phosphate 3-epimerase [Pseudomonadota bacterium]MEC7558791.1 D-allulose-6-phosphate 3-epimerase [Pseudomonadota bacterium]MEC8146069.1 D-allulose-6-phosphate 3-epimerase [Pseudomonadota bacterium]MEC8262664.1 D-allulose-6-phosphate 3-epimerase [Pseudomonadota bacterium]